MPKQNSERQPATAVDVKNGQAVFYISGSKSLVYDLGVPLPIHLTLTNELDMGEGRCLPVGTEITVVQAEQVENQDVLIGFFYTGGSGMCTLDQLPDLQKVEYGPSLDAKRLVIQALEKAKSDLQRDKHLMPKAIIVTSYQSLDFTITFEGREQKESVYRQLVIAAKEHNALAIITVNDAYCSNDRNAESLEGYYYGKFAVDQSAECLYATLSGPAIETWSITVPYKREGDSIVFGPEVESSGDELNLLPGWSSHFSPPA